MQEAIKAESAPIASIAVANRNTAVAIMTLLIADVVLFFNVGKTMNPAQIKITIDMLLADLVTKNLKPEDYKVLFEDMKKGYYGNLYDRFDGQIIFKLCTEYADKRASIFETESMRNSQNVKEKPITIHPKIMEIYKNAVSEFPKEHRELKTYSPTPQDPELKEWFKEFEKLRNDSKTSIQNGRFVKYAGKLLTQAEFLDQKIKEKYSTE